jgi:predicted TIM-barrel fold metal-dependent hydrolase
MSEDRHVIVISTDGHCGADLRDYKPYLEQQYHEAFDPWAASFKDAWAEEIHQERPANNRFGLASMTAPLNWDSQMRLEYINGQGIAAEVLLPNTAPPFYPSGVLTAPGPRSKEEYELRSAGLRAHNRWLADFCAEAPERRIGLAQIFLDDVDDAIEEVRSAKEAGLRGVLLPGDHVLTMSNLYYPRYDPFWAVCADLELPVHRHAMSPTESVHEGGKAAQLVSFAEIHFYTTRAIGHMILSGVFERHPKLMFVTTELANASELTRELDKLDSLAKLKDMGAGTPFYEHVTDALEELTMLPSEYFATNCYLGGPQDIRRAYDLGIANLMWGADIPHSEGTGPFTIESLRVSFCDLDESERDVLLSKRAAEVYHLDLGPLQAIADQVGPSVESLAAPLPQGARPKYPEESCCVVFREESSGELASAVR